MKLIFSSVVLAPILLLLTAAPALAQNRIIRNQGAYYTLEGYAGYGLPLKTDYYNPLDYSPFTLGAKASFNLFLNYYFSVGAGLGFTRYASPDMQTIPVTVNLKYFAGKPARTPFLYAEGGYAMRTDADRQHRGPVYEAGIGYRHQLQNRHNFLLFKLGYNGFKAKHWLWAPKEGTTWDDRQPEWFYLDRPAINFTIAFYHSTRY
ncbi:MAG: hypothetical protein ACK5JD_01905 [Mangrovibacterium sp.]